MEDKNIRFEIIHEQKKGFAEIVRVLRDTRTGVCYLQTWSGTSGGITLLVDRQGNPLVE